MLAHENLKRIRVLRETRYAKSVYVSNFLSPVDAFLSETREMVRTLGARWVCKVVGPPKSSLSLTHPLRIYADSDRELRIYQ